MNVYHQVETEDDMNVEDMASIGAAGTHSRIMQLFSLKFMQENSVKCRNSIAVAVKNPSSSHKKLQSSASTSLFQQATFVMESGCVFMLQQGAELATAATQVSSVNIFT